MTTIAYRDGWLAADSGSFAGDTWVGSRNKIVRLKDGRHAAGCGGSIEIRAMLDWLDAGAQGPRPDKGDVEIFVVEMDGSLMMCSQHGLQAAPNAPFHATGSGYEIALGAMAAGASAEEAVRIACRYNVHSVEPVNSVQTSVTRYRETMPFAAINAQVSSLSQAIRGAQMGQNF